MFATDFDRHLELVPFEWKEPTVSVLDTVESVVIKLRTLNLDTDPELVWRLTDLILTRKDQP